MSAPDLLSLVTARQISGREQFHRYVFERLLQLSAWGVWPSLSKSDAVNVVGVLARWIREAPVHDTQDILRVIATRQSIRFLIKALGHSASEFILDTLALNNAELAAPQNMPAWKRPKLAAFADATWLNPGMLTEWSAIDPVNARLAAIAALDSRPLNSDLARSMADIGRWLVGVEALPVPIQYLGLVQNSAFWVSYLADPDRHAFKRAIVEYAKLSLKPLQASLPACVPPTKSQRPRLTIVGELLFPAHAMFRCYSEALTGLNTHFDVTLLTDFQTKCQEHQLISDRQIYFQAHERDLGKLAQLVRSTQPDIILYPSIGMTHWTFLLSQLRLAPLQLMSVGHPAPACSDHIDGTLLYSDLARHPLPDYGKLIPFDQQPLPAVRPYSLPTGLGTNASPIIAITAAEMKINPGLLRATQQIMQQAPKGTQLHFFPNTKGPALETLRNELGEWFANVVVHPEQEYSAYMQWLAKADLLLQSFPFGGTNTTIDALTLGIPIICLRSDDLPALVDPLLLDAAGLEPLCVSDEDEYVALASKLLNSPVELAKFTSMAKNAIPTLTSKQKSAGLTMADAIFAKWEEGILS